MGKTIIHSNGSKWAGQPQSSIPEIIEILGAWAIEHRFFFKHKQIIDCETGAFEWIILCPISKDRETGNYKFFGNFERVSFVFNIETNDIGVIDQMKKAILNNSGWKKHISKLKKKAN